MLEAPARPAPVSPARPRGKRTTAARALARSGVGPAIARLARWQGVLVLGYHRILPERSDGTPDGARWFGDVWSATPEHFAEHVGIVSRTCDVVALEDVPRLRARSGRHVAITIDDGYRDVLQHALPVLRGHGVPATLFVATGIVDGLALPWWDEIAWLHGGLPAAHPAARATPSELVAASWRLTPEQRAAALRELAAASVRRPLRRQDVADEWLTWPELRTLRDQGVEIAAHTVTHPVLAHMDPDGQQREIAGSADRIAAELGRRPHALAYPVGTRSAFDERTKAAARAAGIEHAYSLYGGLSAARDGWDRFDLRRVAIGRAHGADDVAALLAAPPLFGRAAPPIRPVERPGPRRVAARRAATPRPLRVVTLVDRLVHGGAERLAYQLTRDLDGERFDRVLCVTTAGDPQHAAGSAPARWPEELRASGVRVVELDRARRRAVRGWAPLVRELRRADVLHAHMFDAGVVASLLGPTLGVPVTIAHEHAFDREGRPHRAVVDRVLVARRCAAMIACSAAVRDRMLREGIAAERIVVVPNGIEGRAVMPSRDAARARLGIPEGVPLLGAVGSLRSVKRFDLLLDAVARLRERHPTVQAVIVGDGSERAALERRISELDLADRVRLLGSRSDVPELVPAFDVAISCSDAEASPLAVMEYMDAGRAIVATRVGGVPELLDEDVHGLLVAPGDAGALAGACAALLADPDRRRRIGAAARERRVAEHGLDVMVRRIEELYLRLHRERSAA